MLSNAWHPLLLSVATTSSSIPYIASTLSSVPNVATVQPQPLSLCCNSKTHLTLYSLFCFCTVQPHILYSLCCQSVNSSSIRYVAKAQPHPLFLLLLQPHPVFLSFATTTSTIPCQFKE